MGGRAPGPHPRGDWGGLAGGGGVSSPIPRGEVERSGRGGGYPGPYRGGGRLRGLAGGGLQTQAQGGLQTQACRGGGCVSQHALRQIPPADGYCCGRYASYWNVFLLLNVIATSQKGGNFVRGRIELMANSGLLNTGVKCRLAPHVR